MASEVTTTETREGNTALTRLAERIPVSALSAGPVTLLEVVFFIGPLLIMVWISFMQVKNFNLVHEYTIQNYVDVFAKFSNQTAFKNTFIVAFTGTAATIVLAYPVAYFIARFAGRYRNQLVLLVTIPFWANYVVRIFGWRIMLNHDGMVNQVLVWSGIVDQPVGWLLNSTFSIWLGQTYLMLPFMILPLYASLEKIDDAIIEAAYDLGASQFAVFRRIILPLSIPGLVAGIMFTFIFDMGAYITPELLGGGKLYVGPRIDFEFGLGAQWPAGAAIGTILMLVVLVVLWGLMRYANVEEMFA